uniref:Uncharacterized protein n=1 Tax=Arundo donax TaxID=35708 RepID=A0A0A9E8U9_ARUDO
MRSSGDVQSIAAKSERQHDQRHGEGIQWHKPGEIINLLVNTSFVHDPPHYFFLGRAGCLKLLS